MLAWRLVSLVRCFTWKKMGLICKNILAFLAFLFSVHNIKGLSRRKRICFERYLSKHSLIKHTCSWHDKLILSMNACYLSCVYLPWMWYSCLLRNVLNISNMFFLICHDHVEVNVYTKWCDTWHSVPFLGKIYFSQNNRSNFSLTIPFQTFQDYWWNNQLICS